MPSMEPFPFADDNGEWLVGHDGVLEWRHNVIPFVAWRHKAI